MHIFFIWILFTFAIDYICFIIIYDLDKKSVAKSSWNSSIIFTVTKLVMTVCNCCHILLKVSEYFRRVKNRFWISMRNILNNWVDLGNCWVVYNWEHYGKRYTFVNVNSFLHLMWAFCHLDRANLIETNLRTCNWQPAQFISYKFVNQFWLNLPYPNGKKFSTSNI